MARKINTATVFGATGYTGQRIVNELLTRSASVTGVAGLMRAILSDHGGKPTPICHPSRSVP